MANRVLERMAEVGNEIEHVENDLRERRRLLTRLFWGHLRSASPAVVENRIRATDQRTRELEDRLRMLYQEQQVLKGLQGWTHLCEKLSYVVRILVILRGK